VEFVPDVIEGAPYPVELDRGVGVEAGRLIAVLVVLHPVPARSEGVEVAEGVAAEPAAMEEGDVVGAMGQLIAPGAGGDVQIPDELVQPEGAGDGHRQLELLIVPDGRVDRSLALEDERGL